MTSIAYLVDGDLEKRFIENCCKGSPIRKIGNGDQFPTRVIAKQAITQINLLSNRYANFVLLMDLEERKVSPSDFAADIRHELKCAGLGDQRVSIFIKEKEIEDWILADPEAISDYVGFPVTVSEARGKGGLARILKQYGIKYNEVTTGFELLKSVVCSRAMGKAPTLVELKNNFPSQCWWLDR